MVKVGKRVGKFIGSHHMLSSVIIYDFFWTHMLVHFYSHHHFSSLYLLFHLWWTLVAPSVELWCSTPCSLTLVSVAIAVFFAQSVTCEKRLRTIPCSIFIPLTELQCYYLSLDLLLHCPCLLGKSHFVYF